MSQRCSGSAVWVGLRGLVVSLGQVPFRQFPRDVYVHVAVVRAVAPVLPLVELVLAEPAEEACERMELSLGQRAVSLGIDAHAAIVPQPVFGGSWDIRGMSKPKPACVAARGPAHGANLLATTGRL